MNPNRSIQPLAAAAVASSGLSVHAFAARPAGHGYATPEGVLRYWLSGRGNPPITKILAAAALLGISEREVAQAVSGCDTQAEAIQAHRDAAAAKACASKRSRYATDPVYRDKCNRDSAARGRAKTQERIDNGTASYRAMVRCGYISSEQRRERLLQSKRDEGRRYKQRNRDRRVANGEGMEFAGKFAGKFAPWSQIAFWLRSWRERINAEFTRQGAIGARERARLQRTPEERYEAQRLQWQVKTHRRRQLEHGAEGDGITRQEWIGVMSAWDYRCAYCGVHRSHIRDQSRRMDLEIEHVVPMPHGPNSLSNIVPACKPCNSSKSNGDLLVWAAGKSLYLSPRVVEIYNQNQACAAKI